MVTKSLNNIVHKTDSSHLDTVGIDMQLHPILLHSPHHMDRHDDLPHPPAQSEHSLEHQQPGETRISSLNSKTKHKFTCEEGKEMGTVVANPKHSFSKEVDNNSYAVVTGGPYEELAVRWPELAAVAEVADHRGSEQACGGHPLSGCDHCLS